MQQTARIVEFGTFIIAFTLFYFSNYYLWSAVGIGIFSMFSIRFFNNLGKSIDIRDLIVVLSTLQWIIGPLMAYRFYVSSIDTYDMVISEEIYMRFVVPAVSLFTIGLYIPLKIKTFNPNKTLSEISKTVEENKNIDLIFIISGLIMNLIWNKLPGGLMFIAFLFGNMHFIGLLFLLKNKKRKKRTLYITLTFIFTFLTSLNAGMFHDLILWLGFMFLFIAFINKFSLLKKLMIILSLSIAVVSIQTVKAQFREVTWSKDNTAQTSGQKAELFYNLVSDNVGGSFLMSQSNINNLVSRINQGWIISRVMYYVPKFEPYADGETINAAIFSTILPRFIYDSKVNAGGKKNFERFTGHELQAGTSMNLSILGEAYANYGQSAIWFMLAFGFFLNLFYAILKKKIIKRPTLLFFIPIIYLQVVKAETDFVTVLNHLIKASIFVALVYWGLKTFLKIRL